MTSATLSTCVSVEEFFIDANWEGLKTEIIEETSQDKPLETKLTLTLSVQDFFALNNWQGLNQFNQTFETSELENNSFSGYLTMTVSEFFLRMAWEGKPNIAHMPEKAMPQNFSSDYHELKLTDLSNLF